MDLGCNPISVHCSVTAAHHRQLISLLYCPMYSCGRSEGRHRNRGGQSSGARAQNRASSAFTQSRDSAHVVLILRLESRCETLLVYSATPLDLADSLHRVGGQVYFTSSHDFNLSNLLVTVTDSFKWSDHICDMDQQSHSA